MDRITTFVGDWGVLLMPQVVSHFCLESTLQNYLGQLLEQTIIPENLFRGLILFKQVPLCANISETFPSRLTSTPF